MASNPQQWQYLFSPDVADNRGPGEQRRIKLHPSNDPNGNVIEVTVTQVSTGAVDKRYFRLIEVAPDWREV